MSLLPSNRRFEYRTQAQWALLIFALLFGAVAFRFFELQVIRGEEFERLSRIQQVGQARIPPRRGEVHDRNGRLLARNVPTHQSYLIPARLPVPEQSINALAELLSLTNDEKSRIEEGVSTARGSDRFERVMIKRNLVGDRCPLDNNPLSLLPAPHKHFLCRHCGRTFEMWSRGIRKCDIDGGKLIVREEGRSARCRGCGLEYLREAICPYDGQRLHEHISTLKCRVCGQRFNDEVAMLKARKTDLKGVEVITSLRRDYPYGDLTAVPVGYVNEVNAKEVKANSETYRPGDIIGRRGLERAQEKELRGESGEYVYLRRKQQVTEADEDVLKLLHAYHPRAAIPGNHLVLTIDIEIQQILQDALAPFNAATAVVLEPFSGAILGLYSHPTFNPNHWAGRLTRAIKRTYDQNPYSPMLDRTSSSYPPASLYKVVTALTALNLGITDFSERIDCPGYYEYAGRRFRCHRRTGHGSMTLSDSIVESCDVFFYRIGERVGMDNLHNYGKHVFHLGGTTGVETRSSVGWIPSRNRYHRNKSKVRFMPGWTLSTSVGQGSLLTTPLQVAQLFAGIAADGRIPSLHLVAQYITPDGEKLSPRRNDPIAVLPFTPESMHKIKLALYDAVNSPKGTANNIAMDDIIVAGKTGTAEAAERRKGASKDIAEWLRQDHAWFAGYAPATRPEIVVAVLLEHGGSGGKMAAPVFRNIVKKIFDQRLNLPTGKQP